MKVILDCDGVIFDSNRLKSEAFRRVLTHRFDDVVVGEFLAHHHRNGGVSRFVKFRHLYTGILGTPEDEAQIRVMLEEFSRCCLALYAECALTAGANEALRELASRHTLFVASGSDESELRQVMKQRGLDVLFADVFGSPKPKPACVERALAAEPAGSPAVMVGDAVMDQRAAAANGIPCILMPTYSDDPAAVRALAEREACPLIVRLTDLQGVLGDTRS
jgi:phosphoglycolate phosphatase-like HAD superfamily hydrolase